MSAPPDRIVQGPGANGAPARPASALRTPTVAIVGAGMSGICMGIKLKQAGIESFTIYEKASEVGGTWRENTYPGLTCDVPSRFYQYSFDPNPDWGHVFSPGPEIHSYFRGVADRNGLRTHIQFETAVTSARFDEGRWQLRTAAGEGIEADFLICASGVLHHPRVPDIPGLGSFEGAVFHSAHWDHSVQTAGRRVGVVGTGSTAVQIVTELAPSVGRLDLYQRTAQWVVPWPNRGYSRIARAALRRFPALNGVAYRAWQRLFEWYTRALIEPCFQRRFTDWSCRMNLRRVRDPELRRKLTPDYKPMCKRLVVSSGFYKAVQRPTVELVTEPIERIEPGGVRTGDGKLHELDVLVLATGFDAHAFMRPIEITGEGGLTLEQAWSEGPRAYLTVALPHFPNLFMLIGPHSPIGNHSLVPIAEAQADYALEWIGMWQRGEIAAAAPKQVATDRFNEQMREAMPGTIWVSGCQSWYLGKDGLPELWPWTAGRHREMLRKPVLEEFDLVSAPTATPGIKSPASGSAASS